MFFRKTGLPSSKSSDRHCQGEVLFPIETVCAPAVCMSSVCSSAYTFTCFFLEDRFGVGYTVVDQLKSLAGQKRRYNGRATSTEACVRYNGCDAWNACNACNACYRCWELWCYLCTWYMVPPLTAPKPNRTSFRVTYLLRLTLGKRLVKPFAVGQTDKYPPTP